MTIYILYDFENVSGHVIAASHVNMPINRKLGGEIQQQ